MAQVARMVSRKRGTVVDANEDEGQHQWVVDNATLQSVIANGEDLGPIVGPDFGAEEARGPCLPGASSLLLTPQDKGTDALCQGPCLHPSASRSVPLFVCAEACASSSIQR